MFRELLSIFRNANGPVSSMGADFCRMVALAQENALSAGEIYFGKKASPEARSLIYEQDVEINKIERSIRKRVAAHLSVHGNNHDVPYCLLLMSLVKDVERLGDYAKNISELVDLYSEPLPEGEIVEELREVRRQVEDIFRATAEIFVASDRERALLYISKGRDIAHRCEILLTKNARSSYSAGATTVLVLGIRYYKRVGSHLLNILSSVVMPLHKVDYYDEDELREEA